MYAHTHFGFTPFLHDQTPRKSTSFPTFQHFPASCATYLITFHSWPLDQVPLPRSRFQRSALRCCNAHRAHSSSVAKVLLMGGCSNASVHGVPSTSALKPPKSFQKPTKRIGCAK